MIWNVKVWCKDKQLVLKTRQTFQQNSKIQKILFSSLFFQVGLGLAQTKYEKTISTFHFLFKLHTLFFVLILEIKMLCIEQLNNF